MNYKYIAFLFLSACLWFSSFEAIAQNKHDCNPSGCITNELKTMKTNDKKPLSCKLTTPELQQRKQTVIASLQKQVLEKKSLPDGYAYRFKGTEAVLDELTTFIKTERLCCDFFDFRLDVNADASVWLYITGPEGAKAFIDHEIEL